VIITKVEFNKGSSGEFGNLTCINIGADIQVSSPQSLKVFCLSRILGTLA